MQSLDAWLRSVFWDSRLPGAPDPQFEVHRSKGRLVLEDGSVKILQGVRELFEISDAVDAAGSGRGPAGSPSQAGKLVLIGRGLDDDAFANSLRSALSSGIK
ncbi:MAG: GTP-binding protein [Terriglobus roseus]|nr:GTP-binding protein [Terriglobus roseus]